MLKAQGQVESCFKTLWLALDKEHLASVTHLEEERLYGS